MSTPRLKTVSVPLSSVVPWEGNARRGDVFAIKESMLKNGVFHPIDIQKSTNKIIVGNHRYLALKELHEARPDDERFGPNVDVIVHDLDDAAALRMHIADNAIADRADFDEAALVVQLQELDEETGTLVGTGFDDDALARLIAKASEEEDITPGDFEEFDEDIETHFVCPSCKYAWSGNPQAGA